MDFTLLVFWFKALKYPVGKINCTTSQRYLQMFIKGIVICGRCGFVSKFLHAPERLWNLNYKFYKANDLKIKEELKELELERRIRQYRCIHRLSTKYAKEKLGFVDKSNTYPLPCHYLALILNFPQIGRIY